MKTNITILFFSIVFCLGCKKENQSVYKVTAISFFSPLISTDYTKITITAGNLQLQNIQKGIYITQSNGKDALVAYKFTSQEEVLVEANSEKSTSSLLLKFKNEKGVDVSLNIPKKETQETFTINY